MRDAVRLVLIRELDSFAREVELFPDDTVLWKTLPGISNSAGNLALHAAGNLQHFIGAVLGATGYVRDREAEFNRRSGTREELKAELAKAREVVDRVLNRISDDDLRAVYPEPIRDRRLVTGDFMLHLATHLAFHLGQIGYLRRAVTGDATSSGPVSNAVLRKVE
jgi:hypothetical protein